MHVTIDARYMAATQSGVGIYRAKISSRRWLALGYENRSTPEVTMSRPVTMTRLGRSLGFFIIVALIILFSDKGQITGDGLLRWKALVTLMEEHRLTPDKYSLIQPLLSVPLYVSADALFRLRYGPGPGEGAVAERRMLLIRGAVQRFNKFVLFLTALLFHRLLRTRFGFAWGQACAATLFLLFGSLLIPSAKDFYPEPLWTLLSLFAIAGLSSVVDADRLPGSAGLFRLVLPTALAIALNPPLLVVFSGVVLVALVMRERAPGLMRARGLAALAGDPVARALAGSLVLGAAMFLVENTVRRGSALDFGYGDEGFNTPLMIGLLGQLVSPARGIVFFIPTFFVGFWVWRPNEGRAGQALVIVSLAYSALLLLTYSKWDAWHGGWYWGPRYLLPLSVFGTLYYCVLLKRRGGNLRGIWLGASLVPGVIALSVYKVGVAINQTHLLSCLKSHPIITPCLWDLRFLPFTSLLDAGDLGRMLTHRSSVLEAVALVLLLGLMWLERRGRRIAAA